jgi:hypothetical protein
MTYPAFCIATGLPVLGRFYLMLLFRMKILGRQVGNVKTMAGFALPIATLDQQVISFRKSLWKTMQI